MILALVATFLLCIAVIFAAVGSLKAEAARLFVVGLLFSAGLSIVPVFILRYLDRRERESPWLFAIAIMWGAVIATGIALPINTGVILGVERWLAQYPQIGEYLGPQGPLLLGAPLAAPPIEELTKALGVLLLFAFLRAEFDNMRDGFVYGALVGVGFNLVEAPLYVAQAYAQYQVAPWGFQYGARFALFGLGGHAMFTGIFGAFLGIARQTTRYWLRFVAPLIGLALAILAHTFNNGLGLIITILLRESGEELPELGPLHKRPFMRLGSSQVFRICSCFFHSFSLFSWRCGRAASGSAESSRNSWQVKLAELSPPRNSPRFAAMASSVRAASRGSTAAGRPHSLTRSTNSLSVSRLSSLKAEIQRAMSWSPAGVARSPICAHNRRLGRNKPAASANLMMNTDRVAVGHARPRGG